MDDDLAYIHNSDGREELYHRGDDPDEQNNLAAKPEYSARLQQFRLELDRLLGVESPDTLEIMIAPAARVPSGGQ